MSQIDLEEEELSLQTESIHIDEIQPEKEKEIKYFISHHDQSKCPHCGKNFGQKYILQTHIRVVHGLNPHECQGCDQTFKALKSLKQHILETHVNNNQQHSQSKKQSQIFTQSEKKAYQLRKRGRKNSNSDQLQQKEKIGIQFRQKKNQKQKINKTNDYNSFKQTKQKNYKKKQVQTFKRNYTDKELISNYQENGYSSQTNDQEELNLIKKSNFSENTEKFHIFEEDESILDCDLYANYSSYYNEQLKQEEQEVNNSNTSEGANSLEIKQTNNIKEHIKVEKQQQLSLNKISEVTPDKKLINQNNYGKRNIYNKENKISVISVNKENTNNNNQIEDDQNNPFKINHSQSISSYDVQKEQSEPITSLTTTINKNTNNYKNTLQKQKPQLKIKKILKDLCQLESKKQKQQDLNQPQQPTQIINIKQEQQEQTKQYSNNTLNTQNTLCHQQLQQQYQQIPIQSCTNSNNNIIMSDSQITQQNHHSYEYYQQKQQQQQIQIQNLYSQQLLQQQQQQQQQLYQQNLNNSQNNNSNNSFHFLEESSQSTKTMTPQLTSIKKQRINTVYQQKCNSVQNIQDIYSNLNIPTILIKEEENQKEQLQLENNQQKPQVQWYLQETEEEKEENKCKLNFQDQHKEDLLQDLLNQQQLYQEQINHINNRKF